MWNKDLKHLQEQSGESLAESIAAFVLCIGAMVVICLCLAMVSVGGGLRWVQSWF